MALAMVRSGAGPGGPDDDDAGATATPQPYGGSLQSTMIDEVFARATEDQALAFFVAVGARLAAGHPLPENDGLSALEQAINIVWGELGLGQVALTMAADGIMIDHHGHNESDAARSPAWSRAAAAFLRGAYGAWFQSIGGAAKLHARLIHQTSERLQLHYGL